jgi:hypothetical protein
MRVVEGLCMFKDPQFWIGVLAVLVASCGAYFQRKQYQLMLPGPGKRGAPKIPPKPWWQSPLLIVSFALALLAWVPFAITEWNRAPEPILGVAGWGAQDISNGLPINVSMIKDDPSVRLMGIAYHYDGAMDIYDLNRLQKSALYDVRVGSITVIIKPDSVFLDEVASHKHVRTNYALILVPASLIHPEFSTLRQALAMGAKPVWAGIGPP